MNSEFIPYEEALTLKELGFDEPCFGWHVSENYGLEIGLVTKEELIQDAVIAPLYQQAFKWFRDNYQLHGEVFYGSWNHPGYSFLVKTFTDAKIGKISKKWWGTHKDAELACLQQLIVICKEKPIKNK